MEENKAQSYSGTSLNIAVSRYLFKGQEYAKYGIVDLDIKDNKEKIFNSGLEPVTLNSSYEKSLSF